MAEPIQTAPVIQTDRLLLRDFVIEDIPAIFNLYSNEMAVQYMMNPITSLAEAEEIFEDYKNCNQSGKGIVWAITEKATQKWIGTCGYETISAYDKRAEIGYDLDPAFWGQGLMQEAMTAVISHGFNQMGLHRIQAYVHVANIRSVQSLQRLNFSLEGRLQDYRWFRGGFSDWFLLSLLDINWPFFKGK